MREGTIPDRLGAGTPSHLLRPARLWELVGERAARSVDVDDGALRGGDRRDVTDRLDRIKAHERIPGSEFVVMEESSHMPQAEQPEETLAMLRDWLARNEAGA
jgi:pimeloyl-ACP methyl ester carboxylesterase